MKWSEHKTRGGGVLPSKGSMRACGQPGYVLRNFCLTQSIDFIIFCLKQGIFFGLDDKEPARMFYELMMYIAYFK